MYCNTTNMEIIEIGIFEVKDRFKGADNDSYSIQVLLCELEDK